VFRAKISGAVEAREQEIPKQIIVATAVEKPAYYPTPEKLKAPAFMCKCGHPHRFVCLECGMDSDKALKKKGMKWVEWIPEMGFWN